MATQLNLDDMVKKIIIDGTPSLDQQAVEREAAKMEALTALIFQVGGEGGIVKAEKQLREAARQKATTEGNAHFLEIMRQMEQKEQAIQASGKNSSEFMQVMQPVMLALNKEYGLIQGTDKPLKGLCPVPHCTQTANLQLCGRCRQVRYCSKEHQRAHWPEHKPVCRSPK